MNKKELIAEIAERTGVTKKDAGKTLDTVIEIVEKTLSKGEVVRLVGFGTPITIPGGKVPKFVPGKELKEKVK